MRPHAFSGVAARSGRLIGSISALLSGLCALLLAEAVNAFANERASGLSYALGAWFSKYCSTVLATRILIRTGTSERARARATFFGFLSARSRARGYTGDLLADADQLGLVPLVQSSYAHLRLAPVSFLVVFLTGGWLSAAIAAVLITISIPLYIKAGRQAETLGDEYEIAQADLELRELQVLESGQELRGLGAGAFACEEVAALSEREHLSAMKAVRAALGSSLITEFLSGVGIGLVAMVSGFALLGARTTLLRALLAVLFTNELFGSVRRFGSEFHQSQEVERALKTFTLPAAKTAPLDLFPRALNVVALPGQQPISFELSAGSRLLVKGPSGAGKSTFLEALLGLREPVAGAVFAGSAPIAYITPHEVLFAGSLRENLDPSAQHGDLTLHEALRSVGLSTSRFGSLDVNLGPNGEGLSSGELVRFLIARGIVAQATLYVIDDVTGLLDARSRKEISRYFKSRVNLCVVEATIDQPLISPTAIIEVHE